MEISNKITLIRFLLLMKPFKFHFWILIITSLISNALFIAMPFLMGIAIDDLILLVKTKGTTGIDFEMVRKLLFFPTTLIGVFAVLSSCLSYLQERIVAYLSEKITLEIRKEISDKFKRLPMIFFDQNHVGDLLNRTTTGLNQLSQALITGTNQLLTSITTIIFGVAMLLYINFKVTLVVALLIVGNSYITTKIAAKNKKLSKSNQIELSLLNDKTEEYLTGDFITKTFNYQSQALKEVNEVNKKHSKAFLKAQFINFAIYPFSRFINQLAFILSAIVGAFLVLQGSLTIGLLQAYLQYINQVSEPISNASYIFNSFQAALAAVDRVFNILDSKEIDQEKLTLKVPERPTGAITFENVQFGYTPEKILMEKVNFKVKPKQQVAIVGPSGAGKSTLINLLMRFYEINDGRITFDNIDITDMSRKHLRSLFGMVLQNTWLFKGTVADNISYGNKDATRKEIIAAAKLARCDHFIQKLPSGYDTIISSESGILSQGQLQLLTIARVILSNPSVVILDEATSSVDTRTEKHIQKSLKEIVKDRTSFVIAHRLSTIKNADLILVMKEGDIVEKGNHKELLAQNSLYADLYNSQFT